MSDAGTPPRLLSGKVCILLPVLNEARSIAPLWSSISESLAGCNYVVCFVDDGSSDGTLELLNRLTATQPDRVHIIRRRKMMLGSQRGSALLAALNWAASQSDIEYIVEMDGDMSHRPEEIRTGLTLVSSGSFDVAIASKYLPGSAVLNRSRGRLAVSAIGNFIVRRLLTQRISDYSNGFRFYTRRAGLAIVGSQIRYGSPIYLSEVMAIWLHDGFRIGEFESTYVGRNEGLSKLRPLDLAKALLGICEIAWRYHNGRFGHLHSSQPTTSEDSTPASTRAS